MRHMMKSDNSAEPTTYMLTQDNTRPQKALPPHICIWENEGGLVNISTIKDNDILAIKDKGQGHRNSKFFGVF